MAEILIDVRDLVKYFPIDKGLIFPHHVGDVKAVDKVSFFIRRGETLGIVGESGCGKSTLARLLLRLMEPTGGQVFFHGQEICQLKGKALRALRQKMQIIFQDPYASLNPRMKAGDIVRTPMRSFGLYPVDVERERVRELMERVGLRASDADRYPHQFSGGQRQRIGIARALAINPEFIVADEPVSALDVSIRAQILNLLRDLQEDFHLTYLCISHDLGVVKHVSDRVGVMYLGKLVELATPDELYNCPLHPYSQALLASMPRLSPKDRQRKAVISGEVPSPVNPPSGCRFRTRCPKASRLCEEEEPQFDEVGRDRFVACHHL